MLVAGPNYIAESRDAGCVHAIALELQLLDALKDFTVRHFGPIGGILRLSGAVRRSHGITDCPWWTRRRCPETRSEQLDRCAAPAIPDRLDVEEVARPGIAEPASIGIEGGIDAVRKSDGYGS